MERRTYGPEKTAYPGMANSWIFVKGAPPKIVSEVVKEAVVLRRIVTGRRHQLVLARAIAASDKCFTKVIVMAFFDMDGVRFALVRVSERQAVRSPFGQQKDKKSRRPKMTEVSTADQLSTELVHDNASLARCQHASKKPVVSENLLFPAALVI